LFSAPALTACTCPVGHTRTPVAQCNNIYIFPGVDLAVTAVRPTRLTDAMMTAAAAVSGAATIRRDPHGTLLPGPRSAHRHRYSRGERRRQSITW
jgi:malic enzyme